MDRKRLLDDSGPFLSEEVLCIIVPESNLQQIIRALNMHGHYPIPGGCMHTALTIMTSCLTGNCDPNFLTPIIKCASADTRDTELCKSILALRTGIVWQREIEGKLKKNLGLDMKDKLKVDMDVITREIGIPSRGGLSVSQIRIKEQFIAIGNMIESHRNKLPTNNSVSYVAICPLLWEFGYNENKKLNIAHIFFLTYHFNDKSLNFLDSIRDDEGSRNERNFEEFYVVLERNYSEITKKNSGAAPDYIFFSKLHSTDRSGPIECVGRNEPVGQSSQHVVDLKKQEQEIIKAILQLPPDQVALFSPEMMTQYDELKANSPIMVLGGSKQRKKSRKSRRKTLKRKTSRKTLKRKKSKKIKYKKNKKLTKRR